MTKSKGGRPRGALNLKTRETLERQRLEEQAKKAERAAEIAARRHIKLAKDVLEDFMQLFAGMAAAHQPWPEQQGHNPNENEAKFEKYARLAVDTASKLAPFQSPTFKAIAVAAASPTPGDDARPIGGAGQANVFDMTDPVKVARVYEQHMKARVAG